MDAKNQQEVDASKNTNDADHHTEGENHTATAVVDSTDNSTADVTSQDTPTDPLPKEEPGPSQLTGETSLPVTNRVVSVLDSAQDTMQSSETPNPDGASKPDKEKEIDTGVHKAYNEKLAEDESPLPDPNTNSFTPKEGDSVTKATRSEHPSPQVEVNPVVESLTDQKAELLALDDPDSSEPSNKPKDIVVQPRSHYGDESSAVPLAESKTEPERKNDIVVGPLFSGQDSGEDPHGQQTTMAEVQGEKLQPPSQDASAMKGLASTLPTTQGCSKTVGDNVVEPDHGEREKIQAVTENCNSEAESALVSADTTLIQRIPVGTNHDEENQLPDSSEEESSAKLDCLQTPTNEAKGNIKSNKSRKLWILAVILALIVIALLSVIFLVSGGSESKSLGSVEESQPPTIPIVPTASPSHYPSGAPSISAMPSQTPSSAPSDTPSLAPSFAPSSIPSIYPTMTPSSAPSNHPSTSPSYTPSVSFAPSSSIALTLEAITPLSILTDPSTPQNAALQSVSDYDDPSDVDGLIQRYALFVMDFSLSRNSPRVTSRFSSDCSWYGITCDGNGTVTALRWNNLNFNGEIPAEVSALTSLKTLDLGENQIGGTIPSSLYTMSGLEEVFLHQNRLTGEVDGVGFNSMYGLVKLYLNQNQLTGNPLRSIKSVNGGQIRPLRWLNLGFNNFSGSLPDQNVFLHMIYVLDISNNNFWGPVPSNYARSFNRLRAIFLSSNRFNGTLPISLFGNGMAHLVDASENEFSGPLIESSVVDSYEIVRLHGNSFSSIDFRICSEGVFNNGEMIHFSADCNVCRCQPFCSNLC